MVRCCSQPYMNLLSKLLEALGSLMAFLAKALPGFDPDD
jgi:hypothetical protein